MTKPQKSPFKKTLRSIGSGFHGFGKAIQKGAIVSWNALGSIPEEKDRYFCALNGVIGDSLEEYKSDLAVEMAFYDNRTRVHLDAIDPANSHKISILLHGSCDSEETWKFKKDASKSYGSLLQKDFGYSPFYLRYNSGLHISTNGQKLNRLLCELCETYPKKVKEILLLGHSMGGLLIRSACYYGQKQNAKWVSKVKKIFLLATPHLGANLEKFGNLTTFILKKVPNLYTKGIAGLINVRSAGIKDLRHGYLLDEDWKGKNTDELWNHNRKAVPLLSGVDYYIMAATLAKESNTLIGRYFGDGMVIPSSAAGRSLLKSTTIPFSKENFKTFAGLSHLGLASNSKVYAQIRKWCSMKKLIIVLILSCLSCPVFAKGEGVQVDVLSQATTSWDGAALSYPKGTPELSVVKIKIPKHVALPVHCHNMPLAAYMLSGAIDVVKPSGQKMTFKAGEAFNEVMDQWHYGVGGDIDSELIVFYAGAKGMPLSVKKGGPLCNQ